MRSVRAWAIVVCLAGCDGVFGLEADNGPCATGLFDGAKTTDLRFAEAFSISWDRDLIVFTNAGLPFEQGLPDGKPTPLDIGPYTMTSISLAPEGDAMFYSAAVEPIELRAAVKRSSTWTDDALVPPGTFAGTPSADEFGPRRVLVRLFDAQNTVQEYEDQSGVWQPIGDVHTIPGAAVAPNLTPTGLDMVYAGVASNGLQGVFAAHRAATNVWFDAPQLILSGPHSSPQLLDRCHQLYVADPVVPAMPGPMGGEDVVRRYER